MGTVGFSELMEMLLIIITAITRNLNCCWLDVKLFLCHCGKGTNSLTFCFFLVSLVAVVMLYFVNHLTGESGAF